MMMNLVNSVLNFVVPPASLLMLAFSWPALSFINTCEWLYNSFFGEDMEDKVVIITGASSGIGEQIAYEYAKKKAHLVLVARRENRLWGISENARALGAKSVLITAADVVKEADCRRFITETVNLYGRDYSICKFHQSLIFKAEMETDVTEYYLYLDIRVLFHFSRIKWKYFLDHLVNTASLGHTFYLEEATDTNVFPILMDINFWGNVYPTYVALPYLRQSRGRIIVNASVESWLPLPRMSLYSAAKAALVNFYETLRFEVDGDVGVTIATHGWIGTEMTGGRFMLEEGAEMQWKEEREVSLSFPSRNGVTCPSLLTSTICSVNSV
ncbi:hypothetical protein RND71_013579 [Anisodus tanguticus]|uniref:11-beta-hydroxysteroid dehydrogenase-like 5 n=1 Tax=Anisodus tanguticus TaxID=243964 RepID=A0AAE1S7E7_9SOLA|nr:hypothetical protein RND71_013579 [Anisodus tanguticus]